MTFKLTKIEEIHATGAFFAEIQQDGRTVGQVENRGDGGASYFHFTDRAAEDAYAAAGDALLPGFNREIFTMYLLEVAQINRKRMFVAVNSVQEFVMGGVYYQAHAANLHQAKHYAHERDMLIWDKDAYAFV